LTQSRHGTIASPALCGAGHPVRPRSWEQRFLDKSGDRIDSQHESRIRFELIVCNTTIVEPFVAQGMSVLIPRVAMAWIRIYRFAIPGGLLEQLLSERFMQDFDGPPVIVQQTSHLTGLMPAETAWRG
jgi:hypothetical protein